jgi:glutathione-regulated potassium-efflux system ancillary protein KefC
MSVSHLMFVVTVMIVATTVAVVVAKKLNLGSIVALLVVGMLLGPHAPQPLLTQHVDEMQEVGEIGVMLLMFAIGLDIQPTRLWSMRRLVFGLGTAQYVLTTFAIMAFFLVTPGIPEVQWKSVLVASLALAMSSSAIPFPILEERGDQATAHGRAVVAIDILQGFMVIPVLALIPILAAGSAHGGGTFELRKALEVVAAVAGVFVLGRFLLPWALTLTARNLGPRGFAAIVLAGVFFAGWWMESVGISMALGAFMIGVLLSTTSYSEQVKAAVTPAKQWLLAVFFIAIGMAIDLRRVAEFGTDLLLYLPTLLVIKFVVLFILARSFGFGLRSAILTGSLMMPFDEIAYVITANANANGLLSSRDYTVGITVISFSFIVSPLLINLSYQLCDRLTSDGPADTTVAPTVATENMVIVAGYGYVGRAICIILERAQIPYIAFELDPERLAKGEKSKHNVHYGDVADPTMMSAVAITRARLVIVTTSAYESTKRLIGNLRQFYPNVPAMTAVQYLPQRDELRQMGAAEVVALTPEGTLSFARSVLDKLGIAVTHAEAIITSIKSSDYAALRPAAGRTTDVATEGIP